ncbi:hypothetical protein H0X32_00575 [Patescibacteria group bacterium]|nr:hypothetical protein [Patescibacteria group bacterium]
MNTTLVYSSVIVVVILLSYIVYVGYPIYQAVQHEKELMNEAVPYEQHPVNATGSFLVAGDSTAFGTGTRDSKNSTGGRLGAQYPMANIRNVSKNGLKLQGLVEKLNVLPTTTHYDVALIQIGANDIVGFTSYADIRSRLDSVLEWATIHATHTLVLTAGNVGLSPVFRFPLTWLYTNRTLQVRQTFMTEITKYSNISYVDLYKNKADEPFNKNVPLYYAADHFHPSDAGYGLWYQSISATLQNVFK